MSSFKPTVPLINNITHPIFASGKVWSSKDSRAFLSHSCVPETTSIDEYLYPNKPPQKSCVYLSSDSSETSVDRF